MTQNQTQIPVSGNNRNQKQMNHSCDCGAIIDLNIQDRCDDCQSRKSQWEMEY
jgi:hypothetical protein